jgi:GGDEF domain-containing protein
MEEINRTEEELSSKSEKLEMNRLRFMALLENGHDNVFFYNIASNSLWANDALVKSLGFSGNSISYEEYKKRIAPDDLSYYENVINDLSIKNPNYDIKYRFRDKYDYVYIHEVGKKIYGPETEIISVIEKETNRFERTGNSTLDNIGDLTGLYDTLNRLSNQAIELVVVVLENIKDINEQFDRATGSLAMNDYIAAFNKEFCNDNLMFRTDGREFAFVLTDFKKMEILKRALEAGKVTRANCTYGENRILVKSTIGIVSNTTCKDSKQLLRFARNAVRLAENPDYQKDYSYYE